MVESVTFPLRRSLVLVVAIALVAIVALLSPALSAAKKHDPLTRAAAYCQNAGGTFNPAPGGVEIFACTFPQPAPFEGRLFDSLLRICFGPVHNSLAFGMPPGDPNTLACFSAEP